MNTIGLIPARYASTRFPGKPLININGKSMIQRVYEQAKLALEIVYVATDDDRIFNHIEDFGGNAVMTSVEHKSGTDRCAEAIRKIEADEDKKFDVVVNIQGDEPFVKPEQLRLLVSCFADENVQIATLAQKINNINDILNPNIVKVIRNSELNAIYFSRSPIPYLRGVEQEKWALEGNYLKHLGLYAFRTQALKHVTQLKPSALEMAESLEQLRWLENGLNIVVETTNFETIAIDTPEDLEKVKAMFI